MYTFFQQRLDHRLQFSGLSPLRDPPAADHKKQADSVAFSFGLKTSNVKSHAIFVAVNDIGVIATGTVRWSLLARVTEKQVRKYSPMKHDSPFASKDGYIRELLAVLRNLLFHERKSFFCKFQFIVEHATPNLGGRSEFGQGQAEGFDHKPPFVADLADRFKVLLPPNIASAWCTAIILADVDVAQHVFDTMQRLAISFSSMLLWNVSYIMRQEDD